MSETPATEGVPMRKLIVDGLRRGDARSPILRTLAVIGTVLGTGSAGAGGAVVWATQHYDTITNTLANHDRHLEAFDKRLDKIDAADEATAKTLNDMANAMGKLQQHNDDLNNLGKRGDAMPALLPDAPG